MHIYIYSNLCDPPGSQDFQNFPELPRAAPEPPEAPSAPRALGELSPDSPRLWKVPPLRIGHFRAMCKVQNELF